MYDLKDEENVIFVLGCDIRGFQVAQKVPKNLCTFASQPLDFQSIFLQNKH